MFIVSWYRHRPIRSKLIIAFILILFMMGTVSGVQMIVFHKSIDKYNDMLISIEKTNALTGSLKADFDPEIEKIVSGRQTFYESRHHDIISHLEKQLRTLKHSESTSIIKEKFDSVHKTIDSLKTQLDKLENQIQKKATVDEQNATFESIVQITSLVELDLQQLIRTKLNSNAIEKDIITAQFDRNVFIYAAVFITVTGFSLCIAWFISNSFAIPLRRLSTNVVQLAQGNLSVNPIYTRNHDEIGKLCDAFNMMIDTLSTIIGRVRETNDQVVTSSNQMGAGLYENQKAGEDIAVAAQKVSHSLYEHDEYIQLSVNEFEELVHLFQTITSNSFQLNVQALDTLHIADEGNKQIESFMAQFSLLKATVSHVDHDAKLLDQLSHEMAQMLQHIRKLSGETNILSLNATIEAQTAGQHGKGFAVIASRVKQLAGQTATISSQIDNKMDSVRHTVQTISQRMQDSIEQLQLGESIAFQTQQGYQAIHAANVTAQVQIHSITEEISKGGDHLNRIHKLIKEVEIRTESIKQEIDEISAMEQEQVAALQQVTASSHLLTKHISELNDTVSLFHK
ncbi:methyl-accepting chemotaxis protein [Paenibacillus endoradicis]|uniref:methyl-accepting chemotaxis protein n=1 Tax=Paenibacillus endoradicis TaxID=2972487 RepID=UPI0021591680|nr:methyl-accepting chemotaxis protein [Paenibacillus endoradicis]MCR8657795.1 methyl-accepting chemotaxis protein [Paenibacillus endoradicis]